MRKLVYIFCFIALLVVGLFFGSINQQAAELNYFIAKAELQSCGYRPVVSCYSALLLV
ncbi:MAG: hypothetical protein U5L01_01580 [Rheinheimera sp.]|nr:hypothetical protein [Rheinheimera sp.]